MLFFSLCSWRPVFICPSVPQAELQRERHEHEQTLAAMKEGEKLRVDRMAHDLEIKWTENLRYTGLCSVGSPWEVFPLQVP